VQKFGKNKTFTVSVVVLFSLEEGNKTHLSLAMNSTKLKW